MWQELSRPERIVIVSEQGSSRESPWLRWEFGCLSSFFSSYNLLMSPGYTSPPNRHAFNQRVWEIVCQIPPGKVTSYGRIAEMMDPPDGMNIKDYLAFGARWVGGAMAGCPDDVPWQRVINAQGKISLRRGAEKQRQLLEAEGIEFDDRQRVDFDKYLWEGV